MNTSTRVSYLLPLLALSLVLALSSPAAAADGEAGLFLDPDIGIGFGLGGINFERDRDAAGARDLDAWSNQEGFQAGLSVGVPIVPGLFFTPRVGFNFNEFSYFPDATDTQEETTRSVATLQFSVGIRGVIGIADSPLSVLIGGAFAVGANLLDKEDFVDAGNATNNETTDRYYDAGLGGRFETGVGYRIADGLELSIRFFVQALSMPLSKSVRMFNDGNPDEIREFQGGVIQETGNIRRKEELLIGAWGFLLAIAIWL